jgi:hypothetical protein
MRTPLTEETLMTDEPSDIRDGGCATWRLPNDRTCAATARTYFKAAATALDLPNGVADDGAVCVSELATNALQHAGPQAGPAEPAAAPELWMYARTCPRPQLVVAVFDARRDRQPALRPTDPLAEHGNGLRIVAALSAACGSHPSRSRLCGRPIRGKVTWFALELPRPWPFAWPTLSAPQAARRLQELLIARGLDGVGRHDGQGVSLVSVRRRVNVWVEPAAYSISGADGAPIRRPLPDLQDTAEIVICHHERHGPIGPAGLAPRPGP